jgi:Flp pilus assembly pilin Flp
LNARLQRFWGDERGAETVEWAAVTAILLMATVPFILLLQSELLEMFRQAFLAVQKPPTSDYP